MWSQYCLILCIFNLINMLRNVEYLYSMYFRSPVTNIEYCLLECDTVQLCITVSRNVNTHLQSHLASHNTTVMYTVTTARTLDHTYRNVYFYI